MNGDSPEWRPLPCACGHGARQHAMNRIPGRTVCKERGCRCVRFTARPDAAAIAVAQTRKARWPMAHVYAIERTSRRCGRQEWFAGARDDRPSWTADLGAAQSFRTRTMAEMALDTLRGGGASAEDHLRVVEIIT